MSSGLVRAAVESVAAAHLHTLGLLRKPCAELLHVDTLHQLAANMQHGKQTEIGKEELVVTSLLLIYYEVRVSFASILSSLPNSNRHLS